MESSSLLIMAILLPVMKRSTHWWLFIFQGDYCVKAELLDTGSNKAVACVEAYPQITKTKPTGEL